MNSRPVRLNHRKSEFPAKNAFGKNQFSQPWNIRFARSNSRFLTTDHKISNGAIRFGFGAWEAIENFPTRLGIFPSKMSVRFLSANIWLQLGWIPPCEVSKNLADLVPLVLGHGVIQPFRWLMSTHTGSPKPPKTKTYPKIKT
jgi:hypothetical protein